MALEDCFNKFEKSDWRKKPKIHFKEHNEDLKLDYKSIPPKGAYLNYNQLKIKTPFDTHEFKVIKGFESKKYTAYNIEFNPMLNPQTVQFVSDGKAIYMRISKTQYVKSEAYGKYIYFKGRIPTNSNQTDINNNETKTKQPGINNDGFMVGANAIGITAALLTGTGFIVYGTGGNTNTTNMTVKGVVINTETEEIKFVTDLYLYKITNQFPTMLKEYRKSKRKLDDKKKVIIELNSKF